jgi:hypothetical protein
MKVWGRSGSWKLGASERFRIGSVCLFRPNSPNGGSASGIEVPSIIGENIDEGEGMALHRLVTYSAVRLELYQSRKVSHETGKEQVGPLPCAPQVKGRESKHSLNLKFSSGRLSAERLGSPSLNEASGLGLRLEADDVWKHDTPLRVLISDHRLHAHINFKGKYCSYISSPPIDSVSPIDRKIQTRL